MKTITVRQFASVKRVAQNVNPLVTKKNKYLAKIKELNEEIEVLEAEIAGHEGGIIALTGHKSEELVTKVVSKTDNLDKEGRPLTKTEYVPSNLLKFNEEKKVYEIYEDNDVEWINELPMSELGNDFDKDAEILNEVKE